MKLKKVKNIIEALLDILIVIIITGFVGSGYFWWAMNVETIKQNDIGYIILMTSTISGLTGMILCLLMDWGKK